MMTTLPRRAVEFYAICLSLFATVACLGADTRVQIEWSVKAAKEAYFPGEPVLLTLQIRSNGDSEERVRLGTDSIEAFSFEIYDDSNKLVAEGEKIIRGGPGRPDGVPVPPGETGKKAVVLNQWCSMQLPLGRYRVVCDVDYYLDSDLMQRPNSRIRDAGPKRTTELELPITLVETDEEEVAAILKDLAEKATPAYRKREEKRTFRQYYRERECAREMLAFAEWEAAVPYQLRILDDDGWTWLKKDIILALTRSETLEAATGLTAILARSPRRYRDVEHDIVRAVYDLRDTGKEEIIQATAEFASQHKRPYMPRRKGRSASGF